MGGYQQSIYFANIEIGRQDLSDTSKIQDVCFYNQDIPVIYQTLQQ